MLNIVLRVLSLEWMICQLKQTFMRSQVDKNIKIHEKTAFQARKEF